MPPARIHEVVAQKINQEYNYDENLLRIGTISPDCWRNVPKESDIKDKYLSHFWDFRIKDGQSNDYQKFYIKYYNNLTNPFYFGFLLHLIVDQYWKTNIDSKYKKIINDEVYLLTKNGEIIKNENWLDYFEGIKMQQRLAKKYNLNNLPILPEKYKNFKCDIHELDLKGLFYESGSIDYINKMLSFSDGVEESIVYDDESINSAINETVEFVKKELERLNNQKKIWDSKIKIAIDIDDTILSTQELKQFYWEKFLDKHSEIDKCKKYEWGDPELTLFWQEYRVKMAFGKVKNNVSKAFDKLSKCGYVLDLLSARPIEKYSSLNKDLSDYFEKNNVKYNYIYLGFYSKIDFLKQHNYDILIDNSLRHIEAANELGISTILFGANNPNYNGIQTDDWANIPSLVKQILSNK